MLCTAICTIFLYVLICPSANPKLKLNHNTLKKFVQIAFRKDLPIIHFFKPLDAFVFF